MMALNKRMKILVSCSILWELLALSYSFEWAYYQGLHTVSLFVLTSLPVVVYWLGVWIYDLIWPIYVLKKIFKIASYLLKWMIRHKKAVLITLLFILCFIGIVQWRENIQEKKELDAIRKRIIERIEKEQTENEYHKIADELYGIDKRTGLPIP